MQWLIDLIIDAIGIPPVFYDRGEPGDFDFDQNTLTFDAAWHDLDLSAIVPEGTQAVWIGLEYNAPSLMSRLQFRKNGNPGMLNSGYVRAWVTGINGGMDLICAVDENRIIEYMGHPAGFNFLDGIIKGWWL